jgi:hypothetical protein
MLKAEVNVADSVLRFPPLATTPTTYPTTQTPPVHFTVHGKADLAPYRITQVAGTPPVALSPRRTQNKAIRRLNLTESASRARAVGVMRWR